MGSPAKKVGKAIGLGGGGGSAPAPTPKAEPKKEPVAAKVEPKIETKPEVTPEPEVIQTARIEAQTGGAASRRRGKFGRISSLLTGGYRGYEDRLG